MNSQRTHSSHRSTVFVAIGFMAALYAFSYIQRIGIPGTVFDELQVDLKITAEQVTLLGGIYLFIYAFMQIITGGLVDRFGPSRVILAGGTLLSAGSLLFPLSYNLPMLYFSRALVGLGGSLMYLSIVKELDIRFSDRSFSVILSIMILSGYSGGLLATRPFEMAIAAYGWRTSLVVVGCACAFTTIGAGFIFRKNTYKGSFQQPREILDALKCVAKNPRMYPVTYAAAISFMTFFIMQGIIGKKMLEDCCNLKSSASASVTFVMMLTSMIFSVLTGIISAAIGSKRRPLMLGVTIASLAGVSVGFPLVKGNANYSIPFALLMGIGSAGAPIFAASVKELNLPNFAATSVGVMNGVVYILISILSVFTGKVLDVFGGTQSADNIIRYPAVAYRVILIVCLVLSIISIAAAMLSKETNGINVHA